MIMAIVIQSLDDGENCGNGAFFDYDVFCLLIDVGRNILVAAGVSRATNTSPAVSF